LRGSPGGAPPPPVRETRGVYGGGGKVFGGGRVGAYARFEATRHTPGKIRGGHILLGSRFVKGDGGTG